MLLRIRPVLLFLILLLPVAVSAQQKVNKKGPVYEDEVMVIYKNLVQVRIPVGFYAYSLGANTYEKTHIPLLMGIRYERLLNGKMGIGADIEYNQWNPFPAGVDAGSEKSKKHPNNRLPQNESLFRFTPLYRIYFRSHRNRKNIFNGIFIQAGPTVYATTQVVDDYRTKIAQRGVVDSLKQYMPIVYRNSTGFGLAAALGFSHQFKYGVTASASVEVFALGDNFKQEGTFRKSIGSGSIFLNPFRFYIGYRF